MTIVDPPRLTDSPSPHRFTRDEYYQMAEIGLFHGKRVELIDGEVIEMAAQKNAHVLGVSLALNALTRVFGDDYWIRVQAPLDLAEDSDPEPDLAVVSGHMRAYRKHPESAILIVEVSDTTLRMDRGKKAGIYARAGILDYWIINLVDSRLEVLREPLADPAAPLGYRYQTVGAYASQDRVSPLTMPGALLKVADLLP